MAQWIQLCRGLETGRWLCGGALPQGDGGDGDTKGGNNTLNCTKSGEKVINTWPPLWSTLELLCFFCIFLGSELIWFTKAMKYKHVPYGILPARW